MCVTVSKLKSDETFFKNPPLSCGRFFFLVVISLFDFDYDFFLFSINSCSAYVRDLFQMRITCVICDRAQLSIRVCISILVFEKNNISHCKFQLIANWIDIQHVSWSFCFVCFFWRRRCLFSSFVLCFVHTSFFRFAFFFFRRYKS